MSIFLRENLDVFNEEDYWWRGYSPYDIDYSDDFETLLDALLVFEGDSRFSEHLVCLSKIFDIDQIDLHRDFQNLKDLKAGKTLEIVRKGDQLNGAVSLGFLNSTSTESEVYLKMFVEYFPSSFQRARGRCFLEGFEEPGTQMFITQFENILESVMTEFSNQKRSRVINRQALLKLS